MLWEYFHLPYSLCSVVSTFYILFFGGGVGGLGHLALRSDSLVKTAELSRGQR